MKLSEKLLLIASWLEHEDNAILIDAENDDMCLKIVASALTEAADAIRAGAEDVKLVEPEIVSPQALEEMAAVASAFDESGDELLQKQASVLDEILLTLGAPKGALEVSKKLEDNRIVELKKKYQGIKKEHDEMNKISDAEEAIKKSPVYKEYRILEAPLNTRYCPDHPGAMIARVGEHQWQCMMDHKLYDFESGYTTLNGNKVPGGGVDKQTPVHQDQGQMMFDTRQDKLNTISN
jgi:hypothetical protein